MNCLTVALGASCLLLSCGGDQSEKTSRPEAENKAAAIWQDGESAAVLERLDSLSTAEQAEPWALHLRGRALLAAAEDSEIAAEDSEIAAEDSEIAAEDSEIAAEDSEIALRSDDSADQALQLFTDALAGDTLDVEIRIDLARLLSQRGMRVKAIRILEIGRENAPQESRFCFQIARTYFNADETEGALKAVNEGLSLDPQAAEGHLLAGQILFDHTNRKEEALGRMRRALAVDPAVVGGGEILAKALVAWSINQQSLGEYDGALSSIEEALRLTPGMPIALLERGRMLVQRGELEKGIESVRLFFESHQGNDAVRSLLAGALKTLGYQRLRESKRAEALDLFREAIALGAHDVDVAVIKRIVEQDSRTAEGQSRDPSDRLDEARELFERGSALLQEGRTAEAIEALDRSLELVPANPFAHHQIGVAHAIEGRLDRAVEEFETAIGEASEMELDLPAAYVKLAEVVFRLGKIDVARRWLDRHDETFPDRVNDPRVKSLRALLDG